MKYRKVLTTLDVKMEFLKIWQNAFIIFKKKHHNMWCFFLKSMKSYKVNKIVIFNKNQKTWQNGKKMVYLKEEIMK